jgi:hypothetical protein
VGHGVRGAANGRQYWPVGRGPDAAAHGRGPRRQDPGAVARGGSAGLYKGPSHCRQPLIPPSLLPQTSAFNLFGALLRYVF